MRLPSGLRRYFAPLAELSTVWRRRTLPSDIGAGAVLGIESVPDALARGLLAGVDPVAGLNAYLFGMVGGALFTSTPLMAVQSTGAMAVIVADVGLGATADPARGLFTLSMLTGVVMLVAGVLRLGKLLRFVSTAVLTGFLAAVGLNIVLSQLGTLTGYQADGRNTLEKSFRLLINLGHIDLASTTVGLLTIGLVVTLTRTRLGAMGMVVAIVLGSGVAAVFGALGSPVQLVADIAQVQRSLPVPVLPDLSLVPGLVVPALSLAFVGLVQGAGVSAATVRGGKSPDASQDFVGQGVGNLFAGVFQGMPVGGSTSASALALTAGARTRLALIVAALVIGLTVLLLGGLIGLIAMPALAGLLIVVGAGTIRPGRLVSVARLGPVQLVLVAVTFVLTLVVPLQYAVLLGVGLSLILHTLRQSVQVKLVQLHLGPRGRMRESSPVSVLPPHEVVALQPYGNLFFASADAVEHQLPRLTDTSHDSVVILRLRGVDEVGMTVLEMMRRYAADLRRRRSRMVLVVDSARLVTELTVSGLLADVGEENLYRGDEWVGRALRRAYRDALASTGQQG